MGRSWRIRTPTSIRSRTWPSLERRRRTQIVSPPSPRHTARRVRPSAWTGSMRGSDFRRGAALLDRAKSGLLEAAGRRDGSNAASAAWEDAAIAFHRAMALLYSEAFWQRIGAIGNGEDGPVEDALTFLEVDPWCFRSGYAKNVLRRLKRVSFSAEQAVRLRAVVVHAIEVGDRREFRGCCRLARQVADPAFRVAVLARLRSGDRGVARRALWAIDAMAEPLGPDDRAIAQQILEAGARATDQDWWRVARWVRVLAARYADPTWIARVVRLAVDGGPDSGRWSPPPASVAERPIGPRPPGARRARPACDRRWRRRELPREHGRAGRLAGLPRCPV